MYSKAKYQSPFVRIYFELKQKRTLLERSLFLLKKTKKGDVGETLKEDIVCFFRIKKQTNISEHHKFFETI